ncbi:MAG: TonB-dependent receptor [bacterium]
MKCLSIKLFLISSLIFYSYPVFSQEPLELLLFDESEVTSTAVKHEQKIIEAPCTIRVITRKEIEVWGYRNLEELLRAQHEIDITNNRVFTIVSIRGCGGTSGSERVLFLLDGRPMNAVVIGSVEPVMIGLDNVEQVEILQGPGSAMYGANAFGGVINIITRSADKPVFEIASSIGINKMLDKTKSPAKETSGDSGYYRVCYGNKLENNMSLFLSASQLNANGARTNADVKNDFITAKFSVPTSDSSSVTFYTGISEGNMGLAEYFFDDGCRTGRAGMDNRYSEVAYKGMPSPVSDLAVRVYHGVTNINLQLPVMRIGTPTATSSISSMEYPRYHESMSGLEVQHNWLINEQNLFICSLDLRREVGELPKYGTWTVGTQAIYNASKNERYTGNTSAIYIQDEYKPNKQLTLIMGARYDQHSVYGSMVSPRLGMVYNLKNHPTVFKASAGKAFRPPDFSELYNQQYFTTVLVQKKPGKELIPEKVTSCEAGVFHQLNKKTRGRLIIFRNDMEDLIDFPYTAFVGTTPIRREYINQSSAETKGVEMGLERWLTDNLFAALSYTRLDTWLVTPGKNNNIPYIPKSKTTLNLNYTPVDKLAMGISATMVGERLSMITRAHPIAAVTLPSYVMLDAYFRQSLSDTVFLSVIGQNLLDEDYEEGPDFMTTRRQAVQVTIGCRTN